MIKWKEFEREKKAAKSSKNHAQSKAELDDTEGVTQWHSEGDNMALYNKKTSLNLQGITPSELTLASVQDDQDTTKGTQEAIEQARLRRHASLRQKIEKADKKSGNLHPEDTRAIWRSAVEENWPNGYVAGWTGKQFGKAKNLARYVEKDTREFIEWSVANWHLVQRSKFPQGSLKSVTFPESPDFDFFFGYRNAFIEVWRDRTFYEQIANRKNAGLIVSFRKKGYTVEQAIEAADEVLEHRKKKDDLAEREAKVLQRERSVSAREDKVRIGADVVNPGSAKKLSSKEILARNNRAVEEAEQRFGRKKFTVKDGDRWWQ